MTRAANTMHLSQPAVSHALARFRRTSMSRHGADANDPLVVATRADHPRVQDTLDLSAYLGEKHIQVSGRRTGMSVEDFELGRQGLRRDVRVRCQNHFAAWESLRSTDLLLTLAEPYARTLQQHAGPAVRPCPVPVATIDRYLYWHTNRHDDPANRWIRTQINSSIT